jgi:Bacteriophage minor capsid protein
MSMLTEVETILTGAAVLDIYISSTPNSPDNVVVLYNTGGYPRSLTGSFVEERTFQVKVRHTNYALGEIICNICKDSLHGFSSDSIMMIEQQGDLLDLGRDEQDRQLWSMNFRTYYKR